MVSELFPSTVTAFELESLFLTPILFPEFPEEAGRVIVNPPEVALAFIKSFVAAVYVVVFAVYVQSPLPPLRSPHELPE